jgi:hypothetical protein
LPLTFVVCKHKSYICIYTSTGKTICNVQNNVTCKDLYNRVCVSFQWVVIIYKILLITYKALNGLAPSYIRDMLQPLKSTMNLRSSMKGLLSVPPIKLVNYGQRSFSYAWNELPDSVRHSESISIFKTKVKTYLFKNFYK